MDYRTTQDVTDLGEMRAKIRRTQKAEAMVREAAAKLEHQPSKLVGKPYVEVEAEPPQPLHSEAELDRAEQAAEEPEALPSLDETDAEGGMEEVWRSRGEAASMEPSLSAGIAGDSRRQQSAEEALEALRQLASRAGVKHFRQR